MSDPVEAVLFDVDGTICEYRRSGADLLALAFETVGVEPFFAIEDYYDRFGDAAHHHDTIDDIRSHCFAELADAAGRDPAVGRRVASAYADERDHANVDFLPGAEAAIEALGAEYPIGVVTNGGPWMQSSKLAALGVAECFDSIVYAGHDVPAKPSPDPFHEALDPMDVPAGRAVHVGNSLDADVQGAHAAGLRSAWLDRDGESAPRPEPEYVLDSMADLAEPPWR